MTCLRAVCFVLVAATIASGPAPAFGQDLPRTHEIDVADSFTLGPTSTLAVSPDGVTVASIEQRWEGADAGRNADLGIVNVATIASLEADDRGKRVRRFLDAFRAREYLPLRWGAGRFMRLFSAPSFLFQPFHLVRE